MDFHDIGRGWDEKRRRATLPFVPNLKPGSKKIGLQNARPIKNAGLACFIVPPEIDPKDEKNFVDEFNFELLIVQPCSVGEDGDLLAMLAAIHLPPLSSSIHTRPSVIKDTEYLSTVSEHSPEVQESAAYFKIITQKQQINRAALEGMVLWMQKCMKEDFSLPEMIHHTSNSSSTFNNGWGNAYNIKSIALAAQRKIFVYGPVNREDPRFHDNLNLFQTLARAAHESECLHKAFFPAEKYQTSGRRSLCIMLLGERQFEHYVGIFPRHRSLRESPEFAVTRRYDVSVGSLVDLGYVSSDDDDNGLPRASQKQTGSFLSTPVEDPPKRLDRIILNYDNWDEQFEEKEPFQPSRNLSEQSVLVIEPYTDLPSACYGLEEPALSPDFNRSDITTELKKTPPSV
ncbi:hypothetical protein BV898_17614 [Hypsibius exemplaris]|uniref:Uncharacterized protein n=1 Tax=Hypsibius exemplaris TaxID=2072580 RepID=A0A9X6RML8_HYPEX|nr:hypothetical protein BV898_17614 [Hypsibius exemplaris]